MILSVSRRTDIPAFFPRWFMRRLREGYVLVRNPMNYHQVSKIGLSPEWIDCIVFWTKNAQPIVPYLKEIGSIYPFYFQYTLNAYEWDIEEKIPSLKNRIATFQALSDTIGKERLVWRYDPILLSPKYTVDWHIKSFEKLAQDLSSYVESCVFSFLDMYLKIEKKLQACQARECTEEEMRRIAKAFAEIGKRLHLQLRTCAESIDLETYGIQHCKCVDPELIRRLTGYEIRASKDKNQRMECGCIESVDVGQYNTCRNNCRYCYANFSPHSVATFTSKHNEKSPLLVGELLPEDKITVRKMKSFKERRMDLGQVDLFDE